MFLLYIYLKCCIQFDWFAQSTLYTIIGHYPDGGSVGAMVQFLQNSNSGNNSVDNEWRYLS